MLVKQRIEFVSKDRSPNMKKLLST